MRRRGISVGVGPFRAWESWPVRQRGRRPRRRWPVVLGVLLVLGNVGIVVVSAIIVGLALVVSAIVRRSR